ncbi:MAG: hypothetical protein QW727_00085 [Candidatus Pacearchaeota archaeon]
MKRGMLIISLVGILILLIYINFNEPDIEKISSINQKDIGKKIKISGEVISINYYENNFTSFKIKDSSGEILIICSCNSVNNGQFLEISGIVSKDKNTIKIEANKIVSIII